MIIVDDIKNNFPYKCLWSYKSNGAIISVASTSNCSLIAIASVDRKISLLDIYGKLLWDAELDNEVWAADISKDGNYIVAGTANKKPADGSVYVYNQNGKEIWQYHIGYPVWDVSLSNNASVLALTSWDNKAYRFVRTNNKYKLEKINKLGENGLYGISLSNDGATCLIAAYDSGVFVLNKNWTVTKKFGGYAKTGLYKLQFSDECNSAVVGCREGCYLFIPNINKDLARLSTQFANRPVCGTAFSSDGRVIAAGSFDGRVYLTSSKGHCFWTFETNGEIWGISMSSDGSLLCIGSGDQNIYLLENIVTSSVVKEIEAFEESLKKLSKQDFQREIKKIMDIYSHYKLVEYGVERIRELSLSKLSESSINGLILNFIKKNSKLHPHNYNLHFILANCFNVAGNYKGAIEHYQKALQNPNLYYNAMISMSDMFLKLNYQFSAKSCYRRAIHQALDYQSKNVLYNLARSYEDTEIWEDASNIYEILISWDFNFRNAWERLDDIRTKKQKKALIDYTGVTVNILGEDSPREKNVDAKLTNILQSRSKELFIDNKIYSNIMKVFKSLNTEKYNLSIKSRHANSLKYNEVTYLKYDFLPAEDEIKKQIEMVYLLSILQSNPQVKTSLDIGAATGRYPTILAKQGISAIGMDNEPSSMHYAKKIKERVISEKKYPFFCVGNANKLPFRNNCFNLVTCMMGTFAHFPVKDRDKILENIKRVLCPNGLLVISTWDIECEHLSYLSIYEQSQKNLIKSNSLKIHEAKLLIENNGLKVLEVIPLMLFPNVFAYEFNLDNLTTIDLKRAIKFDLSARSLYHEKHGEMYMIISKK